MGRALAGGLVRRVPALFRLGGLSRSINWSGTNLGDLDHGSGFLHGEPVRAVDASSEWRRLAAFLAWASFFVGAHGVRPLLFHRSFQGEVECSLLIYPSVVSPDKDIQDERPFKGETWGETAFPPTPPCKIPMVQSSHLVKTYGDGLHVNMEFLTL